MVGTRSRLHQQVQLIHQLQVRDLEKQAAIVLQHGGRSDREHIVTAQTQLSSGILRRAVRATESIVPGLGEMPRSDPRHCCEPVALKR